MTALSSLFLPPDPVDTIAARATMRTERTPPGEWKLRHALLMDAVDLLDKYRELARQDPEDERGKEWRREYIAAWQWVAANDRHQAFSFVLTCEALGLAPDAARVAILEDKPELAPHAPSLRIVAAPAKQPVRLLPSERLWEWASAQAGSWAISDAALAVRVSFARARGCVASWIRDGKLMRVSGSPTARWGGRYAVTRRAS